MIKSLFNRESEQENLSTVELLLAVRTLAADVARISTELVTHMHEESRAFKELTVSLKDLTSQMNLFQLNLANLENSFKVHNLELKKELLDRSDTLYISKASVRWFVGGLSLVSSGLYIFLTNLKDVLSFLRTL